MGRSEGIKRTLRDHCATKGLFGINSEESFCCFARHGRLCLGDEEKLMSVSISKSIEVAERFSKTQFI